MSVIHSFLKIFSFIKKADSVKKYYHILTLTVAQHWRVFSASSIPSVMPKSVQIPGSLRVSNVDTEVTMYDEKKDFQEVFKLAHESSRNSTGVEREFPDEETVRKKLTKVN